MQNANKNNSCKKYFLVEDARVYFNADFDSGNVQKVEQLAPYVITPGFDKSHNGTNKTFFHFKVYGLKMCRANFIITRMNIIEKLIKNNQKDDHHNPPYFPVFRRPEQQFQKVELELKKYYNTEDEPQISFSFDFDEDQFIQFAFSYPYGYEDCQKLIQSLQGRFKDHESIYFHNQVLCLSQEKRNVHLITITQKQNFQNSHQQKIDDLFPFQKDRCFNVNKPVILMSARVHPGQSPASFAIEGALRFLLNEKDCRSYLLRKKFVIKIIPMLNPDGVFHGMFRNDLKGQNLNRVYVECNKNLHPTIWAFRKYSQWLRKTANVLFFFDFHAHPSTKNFFIYGNSYNEISQQTQVQFFGKLIEPNCPYFENFESIFSQKQMIVKNKYDNFSKQGCARVFMHNLFEIIHSYTVECGYFGWTKFNHNSDKQTNLNLPRTHFIEDDQFQNIPDKSYDPNCYMLMGKSILITILDLFGMNPYPKKIKGQNYSHSQLRKYVGTKIYHQTQIFKLLDANSYKKLNDLSSFIEENYYSSKLKGTKLKLSTDLTNNLLSQQLTIFSTSPKIKQKIKTLKKNKAKSFSKPKLNTQESLTKTKKLRSLSKNQKKSTQQLKKDKDFQTILEKVNLPHIQQKKINRERSQERKNQQQINVNTKVKDIKFLYNDQERFNQQSIQKEVFVPYYSTTSEKKIVPQNQNVSAKWSLQKLKTKDSIHLRLPSFQEYNNNLQRNFIHSTRQNKLRQKIEHSLVERTLTLRKGSVNKIVYLKSEEIKLLRIANLIDKKNERQSIHGHGKNLHSKNCLTLNNNKDLPSIKGIKKN